ncbi:MAG TPA: ABC transporter ATP-binding protein [Dehalococcoidia bacterium]|jgi:ABC-type Fe3+/spermidine/putrescine transport system ATPase subunit|nr:ABC transporter ATP-binding protein [Dehalococcoidia bacterium]
MGALTVQSLERRFGNVVALAGASFTIEDGRVAAILGPSGCGKTTVLRVVAGLESPDAGDVLIDGQSVLGRAPHQRGTGLMFQELALFPHLDVQRNVDFGLRMAKWSREDRGRRVEELLTLVDLAAHGRRRMHELSGGERQRVALARTLAPQPAVLLLDEPLGALDEALKGELRSQLRTILTRVGTTALMVSHDLRDAVAIADDLVIMGEGRVLQSGALSDVLAYPSTPTVARMLGYVLLLDGVIEAGQLVDPAIGSVEVPDGADVRARSALAFMHQSSVEAVSPGSERGSGVTATVGATRPEGPALTLDLALKDGRPIAVRWGGGTPPTAGDSVELAIQPGTLRFFEAGAAAGDR